MALPPSSIMRARFLANSSMSTELPLDPSSDGARTLAPLISRATTCAQITGPETGAARRKPAESVRNGWALTLWPYPCFGHISGISVIACNRLNWLRFHWLWGTTGAAPRRRNAADNGHA
mgnify:CR=1 FL=1